MKTLIRFSLVISGAVILGAMLLWLVDMRHTNAVAADQPVLPNPAATQGQPWQRIRPPVAISETQILLQTIILDVNLEKMAEMGIDFETSQASPSPASTKQTPGQFSIVSPREARLFAKLLVSNGAAKILAEPTIVTSDRRSASFHSGGEFPLLVPQAENTVAIEFRQFGTSIDFMPRKLADGKLRLEIRVDQADLDHACARDRPRAPEQRAGQALRSHLEADGRQPDEGRPVRRNRGAHIGDGDRLEGRI